MTLQLITTTVLYWRVYTSVRHFLLALCVNGRPYNSEALTPSPIDSRSRDFAWALDVAKLVILWSWSENRWTLKFLDVDQVPAAVAATTTAAAREWLHYGPTCLAQIISILPFIASFIAHVISKSTIKYFIDRGSSVYVSSLDIRKAFDRVHHYRLCKSLLEVGVPVIVVDVLCNWYSKLYYSVKWNS